MKALTFVYSLLLLNIIAIAQTIPFSPNVIDNQNKRQGKWTIVYNEQGKTTTNKDSVAYYRVIEYRDGTPHGEVREYFRSGKLKTELRLLADNPEDVPEGTVRSYHENGIRDAEITYQSGKIIDEKRFEQDGTFSIWRYLKWKGRHYLNSNYKDSSLIYFQKALNYAEQTYGKSHERYINSLTDLGVWYRNNGRLLRAGFYYEEALTLSEKAPVTNDELHFILLNNSANVLAVLGNYEKAAQRLASAIALAQKNKDPRAPGLLMNLGTVYTDAGEYKKAATLYKQLIANYPQFPGLKLSLGDIYNKIGFYSLAAKTYTDILDKAPVSTDDSIGQCDALGRLGEILMYTQNFSQAEERLQRAVQLSSIIHNDTSFVRYSQFRFLSSLAELYIRFGDPLRADLSIKQARKALDAADKRAGQEDADFHFTYERIAKSYCEKGMLERAEPLFLDNNKMVLNAVEYFFPSLSDNEKEAFYNTQRVSLEQFAAFCLLRSDQNPFVINELYNMQLATKALLLNNAARWKQRVRRSGDKKLFTMYTEWEAQQAMLAAMYQRSGNQQSKIDSLERVNNRLEKALSTRSEMLASAFDKKRITWKDIQSALQPGEIAIEMVRVRNFGKTPARVDSSDSNLPAYQHFDLTDQVSYVALIVSQNSTAPSAVILKHGSDLERRWVRGYRSSIQGRVDDHYSYDHFWKPIAEKVKELTKKNALSKIRLYFSPDGVYNKINLNTLYNPSSRKFLSDEIDLVLLTNTKDLLRHSEDENENKLAYLFGYPDYSTSKEARATLLSETRDIDNAYFTLPLTPASLAELPGTKVEVEGISNILAKNGWDPQVFIGEQALEERLKDSFRPRILHIATHGYFLSDSAVQRNPLLRSGLMLTGASQSLTGDLDEKVEDGILTAYEAMNLNLDNTDLIVLSACDTGLGDIRNGEGVYGLQRAFWIAGARNIIMSLWKVDDNVTQQLMSSFYSNWLSTGNKHQAFKAAQQLIKQQYRAPYYWGAFVMIGR